MKKFKILIFIILTTSLQAQTDSLAVKMAGDTVVITNYYAVENCCAAFDFSMDWENDSTLVITEIDTGKICKCGVCTYDLEVKIRDMHSGFYTAKVYRDALVTPKKYIGEIEFFVPAFQLLVHPLSYVGSQGPCYQMTTDLEEREAAPETFRLIGAFPNPFNPSTTINYSIGKERWVKLSIFDLQGKEIAELVNRKESPGIHQVMFDASQYSSGVYILLLKTAGKVDTKKIILLK